MKKGYRMKCSIVHAVCWCACLLVITGCESTPSLPGPVSGDGLFVLNEGAFGQNNAEITYFSFTDGSVGENLYSRINPGKTLGDVANSIAEGGRELFIVVNNSNKIEIVDRSTLYSTGTVFLDTSPRQMVVVSPDKGYVSNMDSTISVIDIFLRRVSRKITVGPYPEGLIVSGGKLYVAVSDFGAGTTVEVIDIATDALIGTIDVPDGPAYFSMRSDGQILLSCTGYTDYLDPLNDTDGALVVLDPLADTVRDLLVIPGHPGKLVIGPDDTAYLIGPGTFTGGPIWKVNARTLTVVSESFIDGTYYGIGVDPLTLQVFAADARGFATNGTVEIYDREGAKLSQFVAGVGPSWFVVSRE
jgi:YVTN family beta-propeller protein